MKTKNNNENKLMPNFKTKNKQTKIYCYNHHINAPALSKFLLTQPIKTDQLRNSFALGNGSTLNTLPPLGLPKI